MKKTRQKKIISDKKPVKAKSLRSEPLHDDSWLNLLTSSFTQPMLAKITGLSTRSNQRIIRSWIDQNKIQIKEREGRHVIYQKTASQFQEYQRQFLDNYIPNKTFFLNATERDYLKKLNRIDTSIDLETYRSKIYEQLMIDISWASSRLEGNTYSLLETEKLILNQEVASGKNLIETQMILNHKDAIQFLIRNRKEIQIDERSIKSTHALLSSNLLADPGAQGALRKIPVLISGTSYSPISIPQILAEEFEVFTKKAIMIDNAFEQSLFILTFLPYLQPFEDMNKRTSRIICNIPFLKNSMIPISFKNVEQKEYLSAVLNIYEKNDISLLKKLFISSIEYSITDYQKVKVTLTAPSKESIIYRQQIKDLVTESVLKNKKPTLQDLASVPDSEREVVLKQIDLELSKLHEGSLVRFNLTPAQFSKWKSKQKKS